MMNTDLNEKIKQAQLGVARLHKIDSMLRELESEKEELKRKVNELEIQLKKEISDVEKLENKSLASIFYAIVGNLDERLDKERGEALAAKLKYDQAKRDLEDINKQISQLSSERLTYIDCEREYEQLFAQKKVKLLREDGEIAERIFELKDKVNYTKISLKEINEALVAGEKVLDSLKIVLNYIESAKGWGTWDLLGGGLISDLAKHSKLNQAQAEAENAQRLLRKFKAELADISFDADISIEIGSFAKFSDFFFDGIIADWYMQSKINNSRESVRRMKRQVLYVIDELKELENQGKSILDRLETEIHELIVKA